MPCCWQLSGVAVTEHTEYHPSELDWNFIYLAYEIVMQLVRYRKEYVN